MALNQINIELNIEKEEMVGHLEKQGFFDSDLFLYNGSIHPSLYDALRPHIGNSGKKNAILLLTTNGGSPDAAYRVARDFKNLYTKFTVVVWGHCKSAGTLMALSADELVFGRSGELGPLDVQIFNPDEFVRRSSGLSMSKALRFITSQAFETWEENFLNVRQLSQGIITTKTAADIASQLTVGIFSPITSKIDPIWGGELQRSIDVALEYGLRLGIDRQALEKLIEHYPSHSFVIDFGEAKRLFKNVRQANDLEKNLYGDVIGQLSQQVEFDLLRDPYSKQEDFFVRINLKKLKSGENQNDYNNNRQEDSGSGENREEGDRTAPGDQRSVGDDHDSESDQVDNDSRDQSSERGDESPSD